MRLAFLACLLGMSLLAGCADQSSSPSCQDLIDDAKYQQAIDCLDKTLKETPEDAAALASRAWCHYELDHNERAVKDATAALKIDEDNTRALYTRGSAYMDMDQYDKALCDFTNELEVDQGDQAALLARGDCYLSLHQPDKALIDFKKAVEKVDDGKGHLGVGRAFMAKGEHKKAIEELEESARDNDEAGQAYLEKATVLMRTGDFDQALVDLDKSMKLDPSGLTAYFDSAMVDLMKGNPEGAVKILHQAKGMQELDEDGDWTDIYLALAYKCMQKDKDATLALAEAKGRSHNGNWPYALILYLSDELSEPQLRKLAVGLQEQTEARTWIAIKKQWVNDRSGNNDLQWVSDHGDMLTAEYEMAVYLLKSHGFPTRSDNAQRDKNL